MSALVDSKIANNFWATNAIANMMSKPLRYIDLALINGFLCVEKADGDLLIYFE